MKLAHELGISRITAFGITCKLLCRNELPLVFQWRNSDDVRYFMEDDRFVSNEILNFWFSSICKKTSIFPYIVFLENTPCGYMEIKNIDYIEKIGELGIFLFGKKYFGTSVAQKVALCWEILMKNIGIKTCISRIHGNNFRSIKFFQKIGGVFRYKEGNMCIFEHEFQRRRRALEKMARSLGQYDEYIKLLHDDLPVATVTTASG